MTPESRRQGVERDPVVIFNDYVYNSVMFWSGPARTLAS